VTFNMTSEMEPYLLLQRTHYREAIAQNPSFTAAGLYHDELAREFAAIKPFLPAAAANVLDIGCGLAGIDWFVDRHYGGNATIHLFDKDGTSEQIYYMFHEQAAYYCSLDLARTFLEGNGVAPERVVSHDASEKDFPRRVRFDLVLSLISWGFHYPIGTYLKQVRKTLATGGVVIVDVRKGTGGERELATAIGQPQVVYEHPKYWRLAARGP
jgi:SAM-dependent methyltransferase